MRPTYETPNDQRKEREVIDVVAAMGNMRADKLKAYSNVDFALVRGEKVWGVCEVKVRNKLYPQMMLSLHKVQALRNYAALGLEARVIYATPEGIYSKRIGPKEIDGWIGMGGRTDRGDDSDVEMCVFFGPMVVNGKAMNEEAEPMKRVCDSKQEWFR